MTGWGDTLGHFKSFTPEVKAAPGAPGDEVVPKFQRDMEAILRSQILAAIAELESFAEQTEAVKAALAALKDPKWEEALYAAAKPFVQSAISIGGQAGMSHPLLVERFGYDPFNVANPEVQKFVDNYTARLASDVAEYTHVAAKDLLGDGLAQGESIPQLADRIRPWAEVDPLTPSIGGAKYRSEMIARTESARAYVKGEQLAWKQTGVVTGKQWLLAPDSCPICEAAAAEFANKTIPLDANFYDKGETIDAGDQSQTLDYEAIDGPPLHPNCYLPGTPVLARGVVAAYSTVYDGEAVEFTFADGRRLAVTANHQLLTPGGFVAANAIREGDDLLNCSGIERVIACHPHHDDGESMIEDVVHTFAVSGGVSAARVPVAPEYLHGDGRFCNGNIDVVSANGKLRHTSKAKLGKHVDSLPLCWSWGSAKLNGLCDLDAMLVGLSLAAHGVMSRKDTTHALLLAGSCIHNEQGFRYSPPPESGNAEQPHDGVAVIAEAIGGLLDRFTGLVSLDQVVNVKVFRYTGHVYDLQTDSGITIGNGIIASNCRCDLIPVLEGE